TRLAPGVVLRAIGFGTICQAWGGLLAGLSIDGRRAQRRYVDADQGAMLFSFRLSLFADVDEFKHQIDEYVRRVRLLKPLEGMRGAYLPGGIEAELEKQYRREGIPLAEPHQRDLERLAKELDIDPPWRSY